MAFGVCKIRRVCNILHVPIQNYTSGGTKAGEPTPPWQIKIMMACHRAIHWDESWSEDPLAGLMKYGRPVAIGDQYILTGDYDFKFLDSIHFLNP